MAALPMLADVDATGGAHIRFWGFLIVGLPWPVGMSWMRRMTLCLGPGRSREGTDGLFDP
jgi:hypothetical protein